MLEDLNKFVGKRCWQVASSQVYWLVMDFGETEYKVRGPSPKTGRVKCVFHGSHTLVVNGGFDVFNGDEKIATISYAWDLKSDCIAMFNRFIHSACLSAYKRVGDRILLEFVNGDRRASLSVMPDVDVFFGWIDGEQVDFA